MFVPNASAVSLDRMVRAVEKVRERLLKAVRAMEEAEIPYAIVGGNAVAAWVSTIDEAAVRNTRDVDMMIRRPDLERARLAFDSAGFTYRHVAGIDLFLDHPDANPRDAVQLVFSGETVREGEPAPNPSLDEAVSTGEMSLLSLEALVRINLTAYRDKDRTHLRDLIEVGLVDRSWLDRLPNELAKRLKSILDDPFG